jgi:large subunit ribosomal protein L29
MTIEELRQLSSPELTARVRELKLELFHLRIRQATGQLEKPEFFGIYRKEIARCMTLLGERKRIEAKAKTAEKTGTHYKQK